MKHIKDLVTVTGEYEKNGETKKTYANIGKLFEREDGSMAVKIDTVPIGFSGWVNLYDPKPQGQTKNEDPDWLK